MSEQLEQASLVEMTAEIVSAYVSHNEIGTADLAGLIGAVADQLDTSIYRVPAGFGGEC